MRICELKIQALKLLAANWNEMQSHAVRAAWFQVLRSWWVNWWATLQNTLATSIHYTTTIWREQIRCQFRIRASIRALCSLHSRDNCIRNVLGDNQRKCCTRTSARRYKRLKVVTSDRRPDLKAQVYRRYNRIIPPLTFVNFCGITRIYDVIWALIRQIMF